MKKQSNISSFPKSPLNHLIPLLAIFILSLKNTPSFTNAFGSFYHRRTITKSCSSSSIAGQPSLLVLFSSKNQPSSSSSLDNDEQARLDEAFRREQIARGLNFSPTTTTTTSPGLSSSSSDDEKKRRLQQKERIKKQKERIDERQKRDQAFLNTKEAIYDAIDALTQTSKDVRALPRKISAASTKTKETIVDVSRDVRSIPKKTNDAINRAKTTVEKGVKTANDVVEDVKAIPATVMTFVEDAKSLPSKVREGVDEVRNAVDEVRMTVRSVVAGGAGRKKMGRSGSVRDVDATLGKEVEEALQMAEDALSKTKPKEKTNKRQQPFFMNFVMGKQSKVDETSSSSS